MKTNKI